ncbi:MAG: insulinase family protein, partial [Candidatus Eisenbacteria bacterium]
SIFHLTVTAKPGHTVDELDAAIDHEIDSLATQGPTDAELEAAKTAIFTGTITGLESVGRVADLLQTYNHYVHDPGYLNKDMARYAAATPQAIRQFAHDHLARDKRVVIQVLPGAKVIPPGPPTPPAPKAAPSTIVSKEPWRNEMPKGGVASAAALPSAARFQLGNGLAVYLVENHALPVVAARLVVRAGSAADDPGRPGLAGFTAAMLDEGTGRRDALTIARDLEALGSGLGTDVARDGSSLSLRALKQNAARAFEILAEVAQTPSFPAAEIERVRNDRLTALLQDRDSPGRISATVMWTDLYGAGNPYGHMAIGTEPGLKSITRDDLVRFHQQVYGPGNAALVLAGDLTEAEARTLAENAFGKWKGGGQTGADPTRRATVPERVLVVDKPGSSQTDLMVAQIGVARSDPDYEKLTVMNQVLGGLFSSRLNLNLREEHGYTYGAYSSLYDNTAPGPIIMGGGVRGDATGASIRETLKEARGMLEKEITPDELKLAKESISRTLPAYFQSTQSTAGTIGDLYLFGLPPDYYQGLPGRIDAMTADQVFAATKTHLQPDSMKVIAVGDRKVIDPQIAALKLGPIGYRLPDGRPVDASGKMSMPPP